jgi:hypothetical protein
MFESGIPSRFIVRYIASVFAMCYHLATIT